MLASTKNLKSVFLNSSGENMPIDCICVDGAVDEGLLIWKFNFGGPFAILRIKRWPHL